MPDTFSMPSDGAPGVTRKFKKFSRAAAEAGISRIYGGIHFQSANLEGQAAGKAIGEYVAGNFLTYRPRLGQKAKARRAILRTAR